jgi:Uma2 family endonuclease
MKESPMATGTKTTSKAQATSVNQAASKQVRVPYLFTAKQALKMAEAGIFDGAGKVELWDGVFYKMTKYEPHNAVITQVIIALRAVVPNDYQARQEASCSADPLSLPEPDVMVYRGGPWDHFDGPPPPLSGMDLLVEVNVSTPEDYSRRLSKYAQAGVPTYWVVDVNARNVAVFTKPQVGSAPARYSESKTFIRGEEIAVVLGGQSCGTVRVSDFFPPEPEPEKK